MYVFWLSANSSDIVHRTISTGDMRMLGNHATLSPGTFIFILLYYYIINIKNVS
jgi:hypothetical protein